MEGGRVNDFIDAFSYQSVAIVYKGEKYFSDGIGTLNFYCFALLQSRRK